jgi:hypothetical protein
MHETNAGGCLCGAVRYRTTGRPERTTACHCTFCQRLTGSAFGIWVTFRIDNVAFDGDARASLRRERPLDPRGILRPLRDDGWIQARERLGPLCHSRRIVRRHVLA